MSVNAGRRLVGKLKPETSLFMLCDMQQFFKQTMWKPETTINTARYMTSVAKAMGIPLIATQQYSRIFGTTIEECFADPEDLKNVPTFEKKQFSMMTDEVQSHLGTFADTENYVLFGIEAQACVQATCLDLLDQGKNVHIIADGVTSSQAYDRAIALERMRDAGAYLTTAQSAAFMLMQGADHPNFKEVSKLTVEHTKLRNEFNELAEQSI